MTGDTPWDEIEHTSTPEQVDAAKRALGQASDDDGRDNDVCVECSRRIGPNGRWWSDGVGGLHPYCAACSHREFRP